MRVLIVDDEPVARRRLERMLKQIGGIDIVGEAGDGEEALAMCNALRPDLLLLDIDMPKADGLRVAEHPASPAVIFTTAHSDHALEAFEANAHDYLVKPVSRERLERALTKVGQRKQAPQEAWRIVVADGSTKHFVDARRVECFAADQKYVRFQFEGRDFLTRDSLDALEERLRPFGFLRVNRAALVCIEAVTSYDSAGGGKVILRSGEQIPVSRRAVSTVRAALGLS